LVLETGSPLSTTRLSVQDEDPPYLFAGLRPSPPVRLSLTALDSSPLMGEVGWG
jgi:hypothetical protein